jgi:hypothetical protein
MRRGYEGCSGIKERKRGMRGEMRREEKRDEERGKKG